MNRKPSVGIFLSRPERSFHMARKLDERGFEVVNYNAEGYGGGAYVPVRGGFPATLSHLLLRTNHDVYFTGLSFGPSISLYLNKRLRGKPYIYNLTGVMWEMFHDRSVGKCFANLLERRFYPFLLECVFAGASRIVCNSRFLEATVAARYPEYRGRLMTIYNGIDSEHYAGGHRHAVTGVRPDDFLMTSVTTLNFGNKSRGLELVIDAFSEVWAQTKNVKLVIAAKTSHPRYSEWVQEYVKTKPCRDAVIFLFNQKNIPDLLASTDLFVFATPHNSNDSLPRVLLEAQSAGLPVVTTDTTGCPEIVCDGSTGFVVPYGAHAFAEKILCLMDSPQLRTAMGKEAQRWIAKTFNWDQMADNYAGAIRSVVA